VSIPPPSILDSTDLPAQGPAGVTHVFVSHETLFWLIDELNRSAAQVRALLRVIETHVSELDEERQRSARLETQVNCLPATETRLRQRLVALQNRLEDAQGAEENRKAEESIRPHDTGPLINPGTPEVRIA